MPTAIDRILQLLPHTFSARPRPTALYSLAEAFGAELLGAENALAEVLRAHWVDHADRGAPEIDDLERLAALYGLAPRQPPFPEETVEGFREHLKRYVRTFLDGTSTVRGVLRVSAETLGLRIDDAEERLDAWWRRGDGAEEEVLPRGDDAARRVFGFAAASAAGHDAARARVAGPVLSAALDLRAASRLRIAVDESPAIPVPLPVTEDAAPEQVRAAIDALLPGVARLEEGRLVLASPTPGAAGRLEVRDDDGDAAPLLLGLAPRAVRGRAAARARITGARDLSAGVELGGARYLRVVVDGATTIEVDFGADAGTVELQAVVDAVNAELPDLASPDGGRLVLASPTVGSGGALAVQASASHDAADALLGPAPRVAVGSDPGPAVLAGRADLSAGAALPAGMRLRVAVDGGPGVDVDLDAEAGPAADPGAIAARISAVLAPARCDFDGRFLRLVSASTGTDATLELPPVPDDEDAAGPLFGIGPRVFRGRGGAPARLTGSVDLEEGVDLRAVRRLGIAVDGGAVREVDLGAGLEPDQLRAVPPEKLRDAINTALDAEIASTDGQRLTLASPTRGAASRVEVVPLERRVRLRFVTRAAVADDAAGALLGFLRAEVRGSEAVRAVLAGTADLSRGVNLDRARFLRIALDGAPARDVDCWGAAATPPRVPRPRTATLDQVAAAIDDAFADLRDAEGRVHPLASHDGTHLVLTSPTAGAASSLVLEEPRAGDALDVLLGVEPGTYRGADPTRVMFTGAVRLPASVDLSAADRVKVGVDGDPVEFPVAGANPAATAPAEIAAAINLALGRHVAMTDNGRIVLVSPTTGADSRIVLEVPAGPDATRAVFGVSPPREYRGAPRTPAVVAGAKPLGGGADLRVARFLRLSLDGGEPVDVDCARGSADPAHASLEKVVLAINAQLGPDIARADGEFLRLESAGTGSGARITVLPYTAGDARAALFGDASSEARGSDPAPAVIEGKVEIPGSADLSLGSTLRVAVDGGRPVELDALDRDAPGAVAGATTLDDAVRAINRRHPGLASVTDDYRFRLASPTRGPSSRLRLLPARAIELVEYPPDRVPDRVSAVTHGGVLTLDNGGAADTVAEVELLAPTGAVGPGLVDLATGARVRLLRAVDAGRRLRLRRDPEVGLRAVFLDDDGREAEAIPGAEVLAGPDGPQAWVPFPGARTLRPGSTLALGGPGTPSLVVLRALSAAAEVAVEVREAAVATGQPLPGADGDEVRVVARLREKEGAWWLVDGAGAPLARVRPGPSAAPAALRGLAVVARGRRYAGGDAPLLAADSLRAAFDVTLRGAGGAEERWAGVTVGAGGEDGLAWRMEEGPRRSALARATEEDRAGILALPRGRTRWLYLECDGARFDRARFDRDRFPGRDCREAGIFDASRFTSREPRLRQNPVQPVFAPWGSGVPVQVAVRWSVHRPGAFEVRLPGDLPEWFGGRFNEARFGRAADAVRAYPVVTEPDTDDEYLKKVVDDKFPLVEAQVVPRVPIGWRAVDIPFRRPRVHRLRGGREGEHAMFFLRDPDARPSDSDDPDARLLIRLRASEPGAWGNDVRVSVRPAGPGRFELTVALAGARVECARAVVRGSDRPPPEGFGDRLPPLGPDLVRPGPLGLLYARAAGVAFRVSREGAWAPEPDPFTPPQGAPR